MGWISRAKKYVESAHGRAFDDPEVEQRSRMINSLSQAIDEQTESYTSGVDKLVATIGDVAHTMEHRHDKTSARRR